MHSRRVILGASVAALLLVRSAAADHGPGTSGGGASTQSGETLKPGKFAPDLRFDWTEFDDVSRSQAAAKGGGSFDFLDRSFVTTVSASAGLVEDLQASLTWGYYDAVGAGETELDPSTGDV